MCGNTSRPVALAELGCHLLHDRPRDDGLSAVGIFLLQRFLGLRSGLRFARRVGGIRPQRHSTGGRMDRIIGTAVFAVGLLFFAMAVSRSVGLWLEWERP